MISEKARGKLGQTRELILTILLAIWILIPFFKEMVLTCLFTAKFEYTFILIAGFIGLGCLIYDLCKQYKNRKEDRKQYIKEIMPILILIIFMIWTLISALFSKNIQNAFWGTEYRKDGYISYLAYAGFFGCAYLIKSKELRKLLINLFISVSILNIILVQIANNGYLTNIFFPRDITKNFFYNINHYSYYLLLATISANFLFVTEKKKILKLIYVLEYAFLLYYLILTNTLGTYIALGMTLILFLGYCIYKKKERILAVISIIILILMSWGLQLSGNDIVIANFARMFGDVRDISVAEMSKMFNTTDKDKWMQRAEYGGSGRIKLWKCGLMFFIQNPILGYGPENLGELYEANGVIQDRPHNILLQQATTSGIIGLLSYVMAIGIILIRGLKHMKLENGLHIIAYASVLAYLISAMFGNSMFYTSPYFFVFLGFLMFENINCIK